MKQQGRILFTAGQFAQCLALYETPASLSSSLTCNVALMALIVFIPCLSPSRLLGSNV